MSLKINKDQIVSVTQHNELKCSECGTKYSSPETTPPPGIKWSDDHVCTPKLVDNE